MRTFWNEEIDCVDVGILLPRFGLCMGGLESTMVRAARIAESNRAVGEKLTYVEIGLAEGATFNAMGEVFLRIGVKPEELKCVGIDIEDGWSLNEKALDGNAGSLPCETELSLEGSVEFLKKWDKTVRGPIHFIFIDGCHEKECAKMDFLLAEPLIAPGGIVAFHDSEEAVQGIDNQRHNGQPVGVRDAIKELDLMDVDAFTKKCKRDGWVKLADVDAIPNNRGVAVFKKLNSKGE
jgi:hypothetical protein